MKDNFKIIITGIIVLIVISTFIYMYINKNSLIENMAGDVLRNIYPITDPIKVSEELSNKKIYVINMEKDKHLKSNMIYFFDKMGFYNYEFVIPVTLETALKDERFSTNNDLPLFKRSNLLTNYNILERAVNEGHEEFFIMEDDIDVFHKYPTFDDIYQDAKTVDWDIIYFEYCRLTCKKSYKVTDNLYKLFRPWCIACCLFTREGAQKILDNFEYTDFTDGLYVKLQSDGILNLYGYPIVRQKMFLHDRYPKGFKLFALCDEHPGSRQY